MHWFSGLFGYFGTPDGKIVLAVIVLTAITTTIFSYVIPAFGRFLRKLPKSILASLQILVKRWRHWWYWRRFGARYKIRLPNKVTLSRGENASNQAGYYAIGMTILLEFENRDDLNNLDVNFGDMQFRIDSYTVNGRKIPYYLNAASDLGLNFKIHASASEKMLCLLRTSSSMKPRLKNIARCYLTRPGTMTVNYISRPIKIKAFSIEVDWSKVDSE